MWGFLIGLYIAVIIYPFIEVWQEQRANKPTLRTCAGTAPWGIGGTRPKVNGSTSSRALSGQAKRAVLGRAAVWHPKEITTCGRLSRCRRSWSA
jgi:hypothetical protein